LKKYILDPLGIDPSQYLSFQTIGIDPKVEIERITNSIGAWGSIDLLRSVSA
jgi:hypothetical protein